MPSLFSPPNTAGAFCDRRVTRLISAATPRSCMPSHCDHTDTFVLSEVLVRIDVDHGLLI